MWVSGSEVLSKELLKDLKAVKIKPCKLYVIDLPDSGVSVCADAFLRSYWPKTIPKKELQS